MSEVCTAIELETDNEERPMRAIFGACLAFALIAAPASKAPAQGLVDYALILVLAVSEPGGPQVIGIIPSTALAEDLCEESAPDAEVLCAALADLELGMPGAAALSVGFGAGLQRFLFAPLPPALPQESKPLLIVAEDVEGETAPVGRYYVRSVVHTLQSDGAVDLLTCDYRPGGPELVHVVQQRGGVSAGLAQPQDEAAGESCADTLQERPLRRLFPGGHDTRRERPQRHRCAAPRI